MNMKVKRPSKVDLFRDIINFKIPPRSLRWYTLGFWEQTAAKWQEENKLAPDTDLFDYFNLEYNPKRNRIPGRPGVAGIPYSPEFERQVLSEDGETYTMIGSDGVTVKANRNSAGKQYVEFPVRSAADWQEIKERRLNPAQHDFGANYAAEKCNYIDNDDINMLVLCGPYAFKRNLMGFENLSYAYYDSPELIQDMAEHWLKFNIPLCTRLITDLRVDMIIFHEDMAFKNGPFINPALFRRFMTPYYKEMVGILKSLGINCINVDTDGRVDELLPLFMEVGVNMMVPFEQAAGNDMLEFRRRYPELIVWGGIDKRVLNQSKEDIKREVYTKVPPLWEQGGYFPSLDHSTQPCPLENFVYYLELLEELCE